MKIFHREEKENSEAKFEVKYISGHSMFPHEKGTRVLFFADRLELEHMNIVIPYADIKRLGSQEDRHTTKTRVFWTTPIVGTKTKKVEWSLLSRMSFSGGNSGGNSGGIVVR